MKNSCLPKMGHFQAENWTQILKITNHSAKPVPLLMVSFFDNLQLFYSVYAFLGHFWTCQVGPKSPKRAQNICSAVFSWVSIWVFQKFNMSLRDYKYLKVTKPHFSRKFLVGPNVPKWSIFRPKIKFYILLIKL